VTSPESAQVARRSYDVKNRLTYLILTLLAALATAPSMRAQQAQRPAAETKGAAPDLAGVWNARPPANAQMAELIIYFSTFGKGEPAMTPSAEALYRSAKPSFGPRSVTMEETNDPVYQCYPPGLPRVYLHPFPLQIIQLPTEVVMLFEYDHTVRHIFTDGREHPKDVDPTWMGSSIGHWEGDTLVVDTVGFNDKTWLDRIGHPHSSDLHVVERMRRPDRGTLQIDFHIEDPKAYTKPIDSTMFFDLKPTWNIMEQVCMDNGSFLNFEKKEAVAPK
jgi:hypothetical protein